MSEDRKTIIFIADKGSARVGDIESYPVSIANSLIGRQLAEDYKPPRKKTSRVSKSQVEADASPDITNDTEQESDK